MFFASLETIKKKKKIRIKLYLLVAHSRHAIPVINFYLVVKLLCIISSISNNGTNDIYLADLPNVNF